MKDTRSMDFSVVGTTARTLQSGETLEVCGIVDKERVVVKVLSCTTSKPDYQVRYLSDLNQMEEKGVLEVVVF